MKIALSGRLQADALQGDWEESRESLAASIGDLQDNVVKAVNGELTTRDNTTSDYAEYLLQHGVETRIKNPLSRGNKTIPVRGLYAVRCVGVEMINGKPTRKLYSLSTPRIDWRIADSSSSILLVTAHYPPPFGSMTVRRTTDQSINDDSETAIQWGSVEYSEGNNTSWSSGSNTRITFSAPGRVSVFQQAQFYTSAGGTVRQARVLLNGSGEPYAKCVMPNGAYAGLAGADEITVAAGDYIELWVYQNSGGALDILAAGDPDRAAMTARYIAPSSATAGRVTLFFFGG